MTDTMRETLSALLDSEADELELERLLRRIGDDRELRETWVRYNLARDVAAGHRLSHAGLDVSARVREALASPARRDSASLRQRLLRPVASLAVAASVAVTVVVGGRQLALLDNDAYSGDGAVAASTSPVGMLNSLGASAVRASFGTRPVPGLQPASRTAYQELARQRMNAYMQEHAEQAALNSPQGLMPFARVPRIQE